MGAENIKRKYDVVIFDLDGTLLDSQSDMADSVNHVMDEFGFSRHSEDKIRSFIGDGIRKLIERAVPPGTDEETVEKALAMYRAYYNEHCMIKTRPYDGIEDMLRQLAAAGCLTAIVSNKNSEAAEILHEHFFKDTIQLAIGQSDDTPKKPDPAMVMKAIGALAGDEKKAREIVAAHKAVYVGDSETDIQTARNAGLDAIICLWGFRTKEFLLERGAKNMIESLRRIVDEVLK